MAKVFISYSHRNQKALDRLHTHLAMLRREGLISAWYDREILAGQDIDKAISANLDDSGIFLPLVSADFLASDYCYKREMETALERHEAGTMVVVPVIVEPCDWKSSPLAKLKALPKDGKPVSTWTNEDVAYLDVVVELRRILAMPSSVGGSKSEAPSPKSPQRRYRIKKEFDAIDRAEFAQASFVEIRDYFQRSINELNEVGDPIRARFEKMSENAFTCTVLNKAGRGREAHITFHLQGERSFGDIIFSFSHRAPDNTANGQISVKADEYEQFLSMNDFRESSERERLSAEVAAEKIWRNFLSQAGIEHD